MYLAYTEFHQDCEKFCQAICESGENCGILILLHTLDESLHAFFNSSGNLDINSIIERIKTLMLHLGIMQFSLPELHLQQQKILQNLNQLLFDFTTQTNAGFFGMLPPEMIAPILSRLGSQSLYRLSTTCKFLHPQTLAALHNTPTYDPNFNFAVCFGNFNKHLGVNDIHTKLAQDPLTLKLCNNLVQCGETHNPFAYTTPSLFPEPLGFSVDFKWTDTTPIRKCNIRLTANFENFCKWERNDILIIPYDPIPKDFSFIAHSKMIINHEENPYPCIHVLFLQAPPPSYGISSMFSHPPSQNIEQDFKKIVGSLHTNRAQHLPFIFDNNDPTAAKRLLDLCIRIVLLHNDR